jgi:hypothetical protein
MDPSSLPPAAASLIRFFGFFIWIAIGSFSGFIGCLLSTWTGGKKGVGLVLGFFLGPIGWIMALFDVGWATTIAAVAASYMLGFASENYLLLKFKELEKANRIERASLSQPEPDPEAPRYAPTPRPKPTPQQFFPEIRLKTGTVLKAVSVVRKETDGFIVRAQGQIVKVYQGDLSADLFLTLSAAAPGE